MMDNFGKWSVQKKKHGISTSPGMEGEYHRVRKDGDSKDYLLKVPKDFNRQEFEIEISILSSLKHPGLPTCYDYTENYIVMDFPDGSIYHEKFHKIDLRKKMEIFESMCDVIGYLHRNSYSNFHPGLFNFYKGENGKPVLYGFSDVRDARDEDGLTYGLFGDQLNLCYAFYSMIHGKKEKSALNRKIYKAYTQYRAEQH
ncbi:MAG: hypothetical protein CL670_14800 [Balneola sp.]|jgi:serine/threonine protein kinase|nr:hypothetical protein [Balneola sp.]MBE80425.1 hypothetical protein [Balneola sp.]|tara:strand:- start:1313 stop:1909 length:597 start_codon:yes stop_codon:yes gene_type:complete